MKTQNTFILAVLENIELNFDFDSFKIEASEEIDEYVKTMVCIDGLTEEQLEDFYKKTLLDERLVQEKLNEKFGFDFLDTSKIYNLVCEELERFNLSEETLNKIRYDIYDAQINDKRDPLEYLHYISTQAIEDGCYSI